MLFLLTDDHGRALLVAQSATKAEADAFGRNHIPEFCGDSLEIDMSDQASGEDLAGIRVVRLLSFDPEFQIESPFPQPKKAPSLTSTRIWVRGPELPPDVVEDDNLTAEDHRDLTLDHIARTSELVGHVQIVKWA